MSLPRFLDRNVEGLFLVALATCVGAVGYLLFLLVTT